MNDKDEIAVLARAYLRGRENIPENVLRAFKGIPKAPLAVVASDLIEAQPNSELIPLLRCIVEINQGRIEDLNMPEFQSYLVDKCGTSELQIRRIINAVRSFLAISTLSETAVMAARNEDNSGRKGITKAEILRLAKKRTK